jgi:hypothetical protein
LRSSCAQPDNEAINAAMNSILEKPTTFISVSFLGQQRYPQPGNAAIAAERWTKRIGD